MPLKTVRPRRPTGACLPVFHHPAHHAEPDRGERILKMLCGDLRARFFDIMTETFAERGDFAQSPFTCRINRDRQTGRRAERYPQAAGLGADLGGEGPLWRRWKVWCAGVSARGHVKHQRAVHHRSSDDMFGDQPRATDIAVLGAQRIASARAFQPDQPAQRRRDPGRAAAVVGVCDRHHAGSDSRS